MTKAGVLTHVVELHCNEACFNWTLRDAAASSPAYDLFELSELDDRLESNLEGLRLAGAIGVDAVSASLEEGEPGASFVAALLAIERADWTRFAAVLDAAAEEPEASGGVAAALGFAPPDPLDTVLRGLLGPEAPAALLRLGVAGYAIARRSGAEPFLARAMESSDPTTRARAYRAMGELKIDSHRAEIDRGLADDDEAVRYGSAWAGTLLHVEAAREALEEIARTSERFGDRACDLLVRSLEPGRARAARLPPEPDRPLAEAPARRHRRRRRARRPELRGMAVVAPFGRRAAPARRLVPSDDVQRRRRERAPRSEAEGLRLRPQ